MILLRLLLGVCLVWGRFASAEAEAEAEAEPEAEAEAVAEAVADPDPSQGWGGCSGGDPTYMCTNAARSESSQIW